MKRVIKENINTPKYWDGELKKEYLSTKRRFDDDRRDFLTGAMEDVWQYYPDYEQLNILDVGCAEGQALRSVHVLFPTWRKAGVDFCPESIMRCKDFDPNFEFWCQSVYDLPFEDNEFMVVHCGETLEHLDDPEAAVKELFRVVKPKGNLVLSVPFMDKNTSPEHIWEFDIQNCIDLTAPYGKIVNLKIAAGGISICWSTKKPWK